MTTSQQAKATGYQHIGTRTAGYLLALRSAAAISATYILRKIGADEVSAAESSVWWYGAAGVYAWILAAARGEAHQVLSTVFFLALIENLLMAVPTVQQLLGGALAIGGVVPVFLARERGEEELERADG